MGYTCLQKEPERLDLLQGGKLCSSLSVQCVLLTVAEVALEDA